MYTRAHPNIHKQPRRVQDRNILHKPASKDTSWIDNLVIAKNIIKTYLLGVGIAVPGVGTVGSGVGIAVEGVAEVLQ